MVYQPMLEVLAYLRANGFKNFIVSGGGIEFMRPWTEEVYGIPPEQVVGSSIKTKFEMRDGKPVLVRLPELNFNDDKAGKPVGINQHIGRRPMLPGGNSRRRQEMLRYTQGGSGATFRTDGATMTMRRANTPTVRPRVAGRQAGCVHAGRLRRGAKGWTVVSMKDDWKQVFPAGQSPVTAIDILLEPDATMLRQCEANNARLLKVFPKGFALDATHTPHITMIQRFVRTADLDKVYAAAGQVLAARQRARHEAGSLQILLHPDWGQWPGGHLREADPGIAQAASGPDRRRGPVHGGNRRLVCVHHHAR